MKDLVFTVDVEEWIHAENVRPYVGKEANEYKFSTIDGLETILQFLEENNYKGTFFILGEIAKKHEDLVRKIAKLGHEICSHGMDHTLLSRLNEKETYEDLASSKKILEDISGTEVIGYRSPCFSQNNFLSDALIAAGFRYTSMSIKSTLHDRYEKNIFSTEGITDFSIPTFEIGNFNIVCTGGGWFRLFPISLQKFLLSRTKTKQNIFYCHPWDFVKNLPKNNLNIPILKRFRHTVNVKKAVSKLSKLKFTNKTLKEYL